MMLRRARFGRGDAGTTLDSSSEDSAGALARKEAELAVEEAEALEACASSTHEGSYAGTIYNTKENQASLPK